MSLSKKSKNSRRALVATLSLMALVYACSFPNPTLVIVQGNDELPDGQSALDGGGGEGGVGDDEGVTSLPSTGLFEGGADGNLPVLPNDAGVQVQDASACALTCDCDTDGFNRAGCDAGPIPDCDDTNSLYAPGQLPLAYVPPPRRDGGPIPGDWNCDGEVRKFFSYNTICGGLLPGSCEGFHGFQGDPGCGQTGTYVFCKKGGLLGLSCEVDTTRTRTETQACQ